MSIGGGTLSLTNVNSTYTGPIGINHGALFLTNSGILSSAWKNSGNITVGNDGAIIPAGVNAGEFSSLGITGSIMSNVSFASGSTLGLSVTDSSPFVYAGTLANTNGGANVLGLFETSGAAPWRSIRPPSGPHDDPRRRARDQHQALQNSNVTNNVNGGLLFDGRRELTACGPGCAGNLADAPPVALMLASAPTASATPIPAC